VLDRPAILDIRLKALSTYGSANAGEQVPNVLG
jgi:hypothetical protein